MIEKLKIKVSGGLERIREMNKLYQQPKFLLHVIKSIVLGKVSQQHGKFCKTTKISTQMIVFENSAKSDKF